MTDTITVQQSSGNVFADLGLPDAEEAKAKAGMAQTIADVISMRGLTQAQAADILGIDQPKISYLLRGKLTGFSIDRLLKYLIILDQDVQIVIQAKAPIHKHGMVSIMTH
jgi:predicted XRE-type DNA-binding protein